MKTGFKTVMTKEPLGVEIKLGSQQLREYLLTLKIKMVQRCLISVRLFVYVNGVLSAEREAELSQQESSMEIEFEAAEGDVVTLDALNYTSVTGIEFYDIHIREVLPAYPVHRPYSIS